MVMLLFLYDSVNVLHVCFAYAMRVLGLFFDYSMVLGAQLAYFVRWNFVNVLLLFCDYSDGDLGVCL